MSKRLYWYYWTFTQYDPVTRTATDSWRIGGYPYNLSDADELEAFIKDQGSNYPNFFLMNWKRLKKRVENKGK